MKYPEFLPASNTGLPLKFHVNPSDRYYHVASPPYSPAINDWAILHNSVIFSVQLSNNGILYPDRFSDGISAEAGAYRVERGIQVDQLLPFRTIGEKLRLPYGA